MKKQNKENVVFDFEKSIKNAFDDLQNMPKDIDEKRKYGYVSEFNIRETYLKNDICNYKGKIYIFSPLKNKKQSLIGITPDELNSYWVLLDEIYKIETNE